MELHQGAILERVIRRNGISIAELARELGVARRTLYNWFKEKNINPEIAYKIGRILIYDFSSEMPPVAIVRKLATRKEKNKLPSQGSGEIEYWKSKHDELQKQYNRLLCKIYPETEKLAIQSK
jgi:DNA-binding XRE family transcriptional regulator